jgi:hypothetical protein
MSMAVTVFVPQDAASWTSAQLQAFIQRSGFDLQLEPFEPSTSRGYRPGRYRTAPAGFEFYADDVTDYLDTAEDEGLELTPEDVQRISPFAQAAEFVTHSRFHDGLAAALAAGCLAAMTGGVILDNSSGDWVAPERALSWARRQESEYQQYLAQDTHEDTEEPFDPTTA